MLQRKPTSTIILGLAAAILLLGTRLTEAAETPKDNPWHLSVYAGGAFPSGDDLEEGGIFGGRITRDIFGSLELGLDIAWLGYEDKLGSTKLGDVTHIPVNVIAKYNINLPDQEIFVPYALAGLGFSYWDYDEKFSTISADDDISFTAKLGGGIELRSSETLAFFIEGGYFWSTYDLSGTINVSGSIFAISVAGEVEADSAFARGGVRISF